MSAVPSPNRAADLYERHHRSVFGYCLARLGRREDAEDAAQTTFVHAVRGLRRGIVPVSEPAWLLGIARNVCLSRREWSARRRRLEEVCDPVELERAAGALDAPREELIGLEAALERLPEQQRNAVLLRDWRGLSYDEVAEQLGVSHAAVETLIFRGRDTLAELLREEEEAPRRRLASLGGLASPLSALKHAFAGGAALGKIAAAGVTAAAVAGSGVAIGSVLELRGQEAPPPVRTSPAELRAQPALAAAPATRPRAGVPAPGTGSERAQTTSAAATPAGAAPGPATAVAGEGPTGASPRPPATAAPSVPGAPALATPTLDAPTLDAPALETPPLEIPPPETPPLGNPERLEPVLAPVVEIAETVATVPGTIEETVAAVPTTIEETAASAPATIEETVDAASATVEETVASATVVVPLETGPPPVKLP